MLKAVRKSLLDTDDRLSWTFKCEKTWGGRRKSGFGEIGKSIPFVRSNGTFCIWNDPQESHSRFLPQKNVNATYFEEKCFIFFLNIKLEKTSLLLTITNLIRWLSKKKVGWMRPPDRLNSCINCCQIFGCAHGFEIGTHITNVHT